MNDYPVRPETISRRPTAFTLAELLVVVAIIGVLVGILIPVISQVRNKARGAETQAFIQQLGNAIDTYQTDFRAYPGPFTNWQITNGVTANALVYQTPFSTFAMVSPQPSGFAIAPAVTAARVTMSENLTLGLLGGLKPVGNSLVYDPSQVGSGPLGLDVTTGAKRSTAYIESKNLSWKDSPNGKTGLFQDDAGQANDTIIPEFVDTYTDPLPILYMRAKAGVTTVGTPLTYKNNVVVTYDPSEPDPATNVTARVGQYDLHQIIGYTGTNIGMGKKQPTHGLSAQPDPKATTSTRVPTGGLAWDAYPYFRNQSLSTPSETDSAYSNVGTNRIDVPRQKDAFILISAGPDRVYGTADDITNFGAVAP